MAWPSGFFMSPPPNPLPLNNVVERGLTASDAIAFAVQGFLREAGVKPLSV